LIGQIHDGVQRQPMRGHEGAEFFETAFRAAVHHQHGEVEFGSCPEVADRFDDQQTARGAHGFDAAVEDAVGVGVIPVVQDVNQELGVRGQSTPATSFGISSRRR